MNEEETFNRLKRKSIEDVIQGWCDYPGYGEEELIKYFRVHGYEPEEYLNMDWWNRSGVMIWSDSCMEIFDKLDYYE